MMDTFCLTDDPWYKYCYHIFMEHARRVIKSYCQYFWMVSCSTCLHCTDPDEVVLFAEAGTGLVGFIGGSNNDRYIVGRSSRPVAVGYDPIEKVRFHLKRS